MRMRSPQFGAVVVFFVTGIVSASWAARIPATQGRLDLSAGALGVVVLAIEGGALLGLPVGGALVSWFGSRRSLRLGFSLYPALLVPLAVAPSLGWLAALLVLWAGANSVVDVAMNAAGVELEEQLHRPILSRLHAAQSGGLLTGGLAATGAAAAHLLLLEHFAAVALTVGLAAFAASGRLSPAGSTAGPTAVSRHRMSVLAGLRPRLLLLGAVAFCAFLIDGGASYWAAVDLDTEHHAGAAVAAAGYTTFTAAMAGARLVGDRVRIRLGGVRTVQFCGVTTAAGALLVVLAPTTAATMVGWIITGVGLGALAPTVLAAAPSRAPGTSPATAIAGVTTLGYLGSFAGPPLIGGLASLIGLSTALGLLAAAATATALIAQPALHDRHAKSQSQHPTGHS